MTSDNEIIPIGGRVLIKFPPQVRKEKNGIVQLEQDNAYCQTGTVIAVGAGRIGKKGGRLPIECKVGDKVYITRFAGIQVKFEGEDCLMCFDQDVLGVMA